MLDEKILNQIKQVIGNDGVVYGAVNITNGSCVAFFTQQYMGKTIGAIRQLLYGKEDSVPMLTRKGLNATSKEWGRILDVLRNSKHLDLKRSDFLELLKLPIDKTNNAVQVYSHTYRSEVRLVIGKVYNYKTYSGKGSGVSFKYAELEKAIDYLEKMITGLENSEKINPSKPQPTATEIKHSNKDNGIDYEGIKDVLFD
jgi:hypothetical protein